MKEASILSTEWLMDCKISGQYRVTFSRSDSLSAKANSLLSITEAAATSRGVDPRMDGEALQKTKKNIKQLKHGLKFSIMPGY